MKRLAAHESTQKSDAPIRKLQQVFSCIATVGQVIRHTGKQLRANLINIITIELFIAWLILWRK